MTGIGASDSLGEHFVIQSRPMIHSISDYHQYSKERDQQCLGTPQEEGTAFFHGIYWFFAWLSLAVHQDQNIICITWAVLSLARHQYFSKECGNFLSKNPAAILSEELHQTRNLQQSNWREMSCQIFHYSIQGKLTIQMRKSSKLPICDVTWQPGTPHPISWAWGKQPAPIKMS